MNVVQDRGAETASPAGTLRSAIVPGAGARMHALAARLFPLPRSISGDGTRQTLRMLATRMPLEVREIPTGTKVFDWTIPDEWNFREAWVEGPDGQRVIDARDSLLHLLGYSEPVDTTLRRDALLARLYSRPDRPDAIPYRNSFYDRQWGFCVTDRQRQQIAAGDPADPMHVVIRTTLAPGALSYAECMLPGETDDEVLLYAHCCHPALANDNLSGLVLLEELGAMLATRRRRRSYRIVFAPTTIGSIAWLATHPDARTKIRDGLVLACLGDGGGLTYKRSRHDDASIDRAVRAALTGVKTFDSRPFSPWGYDERQFGSPGIDLPIGRLTRTPNGEYPEYHTSDDNLSLLRPEALEDSLDALCRIVDVLESDCVPVNLSPYGEPQLGRRGLFRKTGGAGDLKQRESALLWVLSYADGKHRLSDIAQRAALPYEVVQGAAQDLQAVGLLKL